MDDIAFYEVVRILPSSAATSMGLSNSLGIILGMSVELGVKTYAVLVGSTTFMLSGSDLEQTGERVDRETVYGDQRIQVLPEDYS
jgi:hypothetical protein